MKTTKRIFSLALAFVLALALLIPAAADYFHAEWTPIPDPASNPNAPIITRQPVRTAVIAGNDMVLEVAAELPEDVEGELSFAWFRYGSDEVLGTEPRLVMETIGNFTYGIEGELFDGVGGFFDDLIRAMLNPFLPRELQVYVVVTNTYIDTYGTTQTVPTQSTVAQAQSLLGIGALFRQIWQLHTQNGAMGYIMLLPMLLYWIPVAPPYLVLGVLNHLMVWTSR